VSAENKVRKVIDDPNAPERLRGKVVEAWIDEEQHNLCFQVDLPGDATPNELAYFKYSVGEIADQLRKKFPFVGESQTCTFKGQQA
jgi:hypothetical protein